MKTPTGSTMKVTMQTLANALDLPLSTVKRWVRQGRIPVQRSGNDAVFSRTAVQRWAQSRQLAFVLDSAPTPGAPSETFEGLSTVMQRGGTFHRVPGADVRGVLRSAVDCIDFLSPKVRDELFDTLLAREQLASTGIGNGIAIPHPRNPLSHAPATPAITTCFLAHPVPFKAVDDQPVSVLFLLISPTVKYHLHLLSRLSYCIRDGSFVRFLHGTPDAETLVKRIAAFEKQLDEH